MTHLFEDKHKHRTGRLFGVLHQAPVLVELEVERRHVLHHLQSTDEDEEFAISNLISILDPVSRDVDDGPVEESLGKNSLDVDVDDYHGIESALLCWPDKTWPLLRERLVNSALLKFW